MNKIIFLWLCANLSTFEHIWSACFSLCVFFITHLREKRLKQKTIVSCRQKYGFYAFYLKCKENDLHKKDMLFSRGLLKMHSSFIFPDRTNLMISLHLTLFRVYKKYFYLIFVEKLNFVNSHFFRFS